MKRIRNLFAIIMIAAISIFMSGCWNYRDIDRLNVVTGITVDKSPDKSKYLVTAEIVEIETGGREAMVNPSQMQAEGETFFDALRNMVSAAGKKLFVSHMKVIIISQDVAREGITQILDFIMRDNEPRLEMELLVSREETANEILNYKSIGEKLRCLKLHEMLESQKNLSKAPIIECVKFIQAVSSDGECGILPLVGNTVINGEKALEISGTAIFKKDKLIGFLNGDETKYLLFINNMINAGILPEMGKGENTNHSVSLEIFKNKTKIKPVYSNGKITININAKTTVAIGEDGSRTNLIDKKKRDILKTSAEKSLEKNIKALVKKVQDEYNADIFGFGNQVKMQMPSTWRKISYNWDDLFQDLTVNVKSEMEIRASGTSEKPVNIGE